MISESQSVAIVGLNPIEVGVEVDVSNGLPGLHIVGLPDKSVDESRERVRSAIKAVGAAFPAQRITVNLTPADIRKEGPAFDLPIAIAIIAATGQIDIPVSSVLVGELSLSGKIKPVRGILAITSFASEKGVNQIFVPQENAKEASIIRGIRVYGIRSLQEIIDYLRSEKSLTPEPPLRRIQDSKVPAVELSSIYGQMNAKRSLEIAAAGGHNLLLSGPPGTGKTLLAKALPGILPPLSSEEVLEVSRIYSVAGLLNHGAYLQTERPFRSPHHSISLAGLIGGGSWPRPGELSLAHKGVLFLDELLEFPRHVLEAIRGPLEDRVVRISRAQHTLIFPTDCAVVGSLNPCPCGFSTDDEAVCTCSPTTISNYWKRLSGPLQDRFDMRVEVRRLPYSLMRNGNGDTTTEVRQRVIESKMRQNSRLKGRNNASMSPQEVSQTCKLSNSAENLVAEAVNNWHLSVRGYHRVLKVARTIADLDGQKLITDNAIAEALQYRGMENSTSTAF